MSLFSSLMQKKRKIQGLGTLGDVGDAELAVGANFYYLG